MEKAMQLHVHLWMEENGETTLGMGRAVLLAKIREHGSLRQAAADMRMSYRAAWGKLKSAETRLGLTLVRKARGQRFELTEDGARLCEAFLALHAEVEAFACRRATELLGIPCRVGGDATVGDDTLHRRNGVREPSLQKAAAAHEPLDPKD